LPRAIALLLGSLGISATITAINPFVTLDLAGWARTVLSAAELPQVLLDIVLGLLLFAASLHVDLTELRREKWIVLILATASVTIATLVFRTGIWIVFHVVGTPVPLGWCMVLGAVLAPTDAVVVDALLRKARCLQLLEQPSLARAYSMTVRVSCCFRSCSAWPRASTDWSVTARSPCPWLSRGWVVAHWDVPPLSSPPA
jgi:hypothetical protein